MKNDITDIYYVNAEDEAPKTKKNDRTKKQPASIPAILFWSFMEAVGIFTLVCGFLHTDIQTIGIVPSLGYVVGLSGMIFGFLLLFPTRRRKNSASGKNYSHRRKAA